MDESKSSYIVPSLGVEVVEIIYKAKTWVNVFFSLATKG